MAELSGLILPIGRWMLMEACSEAMRLGERDGRLPRVSVNVDWRPAGPATIYAGYQYYRGGIVSTATTPGAFKIVLAAEAIEPDDAFGGFSPSA